MVNSASPRPARIVLLLEDLKFGGTQRQTLELARGLDRTRFQPEIWSMTGGDDLAPLARSWSIPLVFLARGKIAGPASLARVWLGLRRTPPDLLLCLTAVPNIWGRILGRATGLPLIVGNVRGLSYDRQHEGWLWPLADHILCNTKAIQDILHKDCQISSSRITVIPNGVDTDFFRRPPAVRRHGKPVILSVGRLVEDKDQETLIRAFYLLSADHPDAELWLVGDGPWKQRLERLAQRLLPGDRVQFLPGREDLRPLLAAAQLLALSSRKEAFPNVVLEAMAMELPVAATRVGGVPEMVTPGETGWLTPPGNAPALAAALGQLLSDPETRQAFGRAGRQRVLQNFSLAAMVRRYEEVFAHLLERKAAKRLSPAEKLPGPRLAETHRRRWFGGGGERGAVVTPGPTLPPSAAAKTGPRVAYFLLWFPEPSQTFIVDEVNTIHRLGLDVRVYTLYGPRPPRRIEGMAPVSVPVHHLGLASLGTLILDLLRLCQRRRALARRVLAETMVRRWRRLETAGEALWATLAGVHLARLLRAAGVGHIHSCWADGPATAAWVASRLSGIPFSFASHAYDIYPPDGALVEKMGAASFVRVNNLVNRDYLLALGPDAAAKLTLIRGGMPLTPAPAATMPPHPPYQLLTLGRLVPKKGFPVLLQACRDLAAQGLDFHLTLAGDGPQLRELQELAGEYGLSGRVHFIGFVPHCRVPELFQHAHLFVLPCIIDPHGDRDGLPTVILEAMIHEVPVVASDITGIPEVVVPGETGWLVDPGDPRVLAQAIMEALTQPEEARNRARAGKQLVLRDYNSRKNYGRLKDCLEKWSLR